MSDGRPLLEFEVRVSGGAQVKAIYAALLANGTIKAS